MKKHVYRFFCGVVLGLSALAPGFSGSVVAIAMGLYEDLVGILSNPAKEIKRNLVFLFPIGVGIVMSAVLFVLGFSMLIETHMKATFLLFTGLMAGSLPMIVREVRRHPFRKQYGIGWILAFALALAISLAGQGMSVTTGGESEVGMVLLALAGFFVGAIMLVPGMSISALLIMLGVYGRLVYMAEGLVRLDFSHALPLLAVLFCALLGLVLMSRGIKTVLESFPGFANTCILGFMAGTLLGVFAESLAIYDADFSWWHGALALALGLGLSLIFVVIGKNAGTKKSEA